MNIKETFLKLTSRTYPHGSESELYPLLPDNLCVDVFGNLFLQIGDSSVMFTSHLDTATSALVKVNHVIEGDTIKTDGTTILGADDKAGVTIMIHMIENNIPGLYYFFIGEEVGCVGSKKLSELHKTCKLDYINKVISFDRRGTNSVITYQSNGRCCSDDFAEELAKELNKADTTFHYKKDPTGIYTDSAQFTKLYPECTNISVGYYAEHTFSENQDIDHLEKLANACLKVEWEKLPVKRDPSVIDYGNWGYGDYDYEYSYGYGRYGQSYDKKYDYGNVSNSSFNKPLLKKSEKEWFHDWKFNYISNFEIDKLTQKVITVDLCADRISYESQMIRDLLRSLELDFQYIEWDGFKLKVVYFEDHSTSCDRNDLLDYLPEFDYRDIGKEGEDRKNISNLHNGYCDDLAD